MPGPTTSRWASRPAATPRNLLRALEHAARAGLLTLGLAGYDGGDMRGAATLDACLVVGSDSVHRIQEMQAALAWRLWSEVQACLDEDATGV